MSEIDTLNKRVHLLEMLLEDFMKISAVTMIPDQTINMDIIYSAYIKAFNGIVAEVDK